MANFKNNSEKLNFENNNIGNNNNNNNDDNTVHNIKNAAKNGHLILHVCILMNLISLFIIGILGLLFMNIKDETFVEYFDLIYVFILIICVLFKYINKRIARYIDYYRYLLIYDKLNQNNNNNNQIVTLNKLI